MALELKLNITSTGQGFPREATVIALSEVIKAIEDAVAPYGLRIYSMKQGRTVTFPVLGREKTQHDL